MRVLNTLKIGLGAAVLASGLFLSAGTALACNTGCHPPAPPTRPNNPPAPNMPHYGGGHGGGHGGGYYQGGDVNVKSNVVVNNNISTGGGYGVRYGNIAGSYSQGGYGGFSNWSQTPNYPQSLGLNVETAQAEEYEEVVERHEASSYSETFIVQANCIDDKGVPHPASQVEGVRDISNGYRGEIYRCIAGTRMQYTIAKYEGDAFGFKGGETLMCSKNDALWYEGGKLTCRVQTPARECNERSLLRRFGAGYKLLTITHYQEAREERKMVRREVQKSSSGASYMVFDGGVGGYVQ